MKSFFALPSDRPQSSTAVFAAAAISMLSLITVATPAAAQPGDLADRRIEQLLRQLATQDTKAARAAPVTREAGVRVVGTIRRVSQFTLPLTCDVFFFSDRDGHSEEKSAPVIFNGTLGSCTVNIPFKWTNTDPDGKLGVNVFVSNAVPGGFLTAAAAPTPISRSSSIGFPPVPLPDQGKTTQLTFDIRM